MFDNQKLLAFNSHFNSPFLYILTEAITTVLDK